MQEDLDASQQETDRLRGYNEAQSHDKDQIIESKLPQLVARVMEISRKEDGYAERDIAAQVLER